MSRLQNLKDSVDRLRNMLEEVDSLDCRFINNEDRADIENWMVEMKMETLAEESLSSCIRDIFMYGHEGISNSSDIDLIEEYVYSVNGVPDSDFDGYGQLKTSERVIKHKIDDMVENVLLDTVKKSNKQ